MIGNDRETPATERCHKPNKAGKPGEKLNLAQGVLNVGRMSSTCKVCGMTYGHHLDDRASHSKYHATFVNGPGWNFPGDAVRGIVIRKSPLRLQTTRPKSLTLAQLASRASRLTSSSLLTSPKFATQLQFYVAKASVAAQVARVEALLDMVNRELNAPATNDSWKSPHNHEFPGKAFVAVVNKKAVGICVTEPIKSAFWLVSRTQHVVPNQEIKDARVGISRIWVAPSWRRCGVAMELLDVVVHHSVYGMKLEKLQVAFSQPSFAGGLLAIRFNGVKHKSGETLVPVYLEE